MIKNSAILRVNKKNILKNYNFFKKLNKNLIVAPTIKANAYGFGDKKIFDLLIKNNCRHFFVATIEEGIRIANRNKNIFIYVLNGIQNYNLKLFKKYNLVPIINTISELKIINKSKLKFGLHIDTGINRLGIKYNEIPNSTFSNKNISIIISHLSSADEINNKFNEIQKKRFCDLMSKFNSNNIIYSLANSNGAVISKSFLFDMVRPGIGLYGGNNNNKKLINKINSVATLSGKIIQIKIINKNEFVGYNQTYKAEKKIKVAVIGIGYEDGIPRILSNTGYVYYKNNKFKIIGRISMDSLTIDITKSKHNLRVGLFVQIIDNMHGIEEFAKKSKTISNEIITSIGSRVKRIYVK